MKRLSSLVLIGLFLPIIAYAGNTTVSGTSTNTGDIRGGTGSVSVETPLNMGLFNQASSNIENIRIQFCNYDYKLIRYKLSPGKAQDICLKIGNNANKDISINIEFVDGTVTNDKSKSRACKANGDNKVFGQYVSGIISPIIVPANGSIIRHATLQYPPETKGDISGCLVYYSSDGTMLGGPQVSFNMIIRKALFIDTFIKLPFRLAYGRKILGLLIIIIIGFRKKIKQYIFAIHKKIKSTHKKTK